MPEAAFMGARVRLQLLAQERGSLPVLLLTRHPVEREQASARENVVKVVVLCFVSAYGSVRIDEAVYDVLDVVKIFSVPRLVPDAFDALEEDALLVTPFL